jgi:hypothetical protein
MTFPTTSSFGARRWEGHERGGKYPFSASTVRKIILGLDYRAQF